MSEQPNGLDEMNCAYKTTIVTVEIDAMVLQSWPPPRHAALTAWLFVVFAQFPPPSDR